MSQIHEWMYEDKAVNQFFDCYYAFYPELGFMSRKEFSVQKISDLKYKVSCTLRNGNTLEAIQLLDAFSMSLFSLHAVRKNPDEQMIVPKIIRRRAR